MSTQIIVKIEKQIKPLSAPLTITIPEQMALASARRTQLKAIEKAAEAEKQKVLKPLNAARKAEQDRWKPIETELTTALTSLDREMTRYQTEQTRLARIEEEKIAARVGEGRGYLRPETAIEKMANIDRPDTVLHNEDNSGATGFRPVPCFEVMDIVMLLEKGGEAYVLPNETAIREAMKNGIKLAGVNYWIEQRPVNR